MNIQESKEQKSVDVRRLEKGSGKESNTKEER